MKKGICALLLAFMLTLGLSGSVCATSSPAYTTDYLSTEVTVNRDNTYNVRQTFTVTFTEPAHGLYFYVPMDGTYYTTVDGKETEIPYHAAVTHIDVEGWETDISTENGSKVIRAGSEDTTVTGTQTFVLTYTWDPGADRVSGFDMVYLNLLKGWQTGVTAGDFTITLPEDVDASAVTFIVGAYGATQTERTDFSVSGNVITGALNRPLQEGENITLYIHLRDGYFVGARTGDEWNFVPVTVSIVVLVVSIALWLTKGRKGAAPPEPVTFYPPDGMTPAQVGTIIDGAAENKEVLSLLIYFADKGYLTIEDKGDDSFVFHKLKDLPEDAETFEKSVFFGLFPGKREESTTEHLSQTFPNHVASAKEEIKAWFEWPERRLVEPVSQKVCNLLKWLIFVPFFALGATIGYRINGYFDLPTVLVCSCLVGIVGNVFTELFVDTYAKKDGMQKSSARRRLIIFALLTAIIDMVVIFLSPNAFVGLFCLIVTLAIAILSLNAGKLTPQGNQWIGEVRGFKHFIETAEADRIRVLVDENPSYFYNILPYAYVLGVTDQWAKKFENMAIAPPAWYIGYGGYDMFDIMLFNYHMHHAMNCFTTDLTIPSDAGSGGFGGGGFTGGGFGGGGGFSGGGGGGTGGGSW